MALESDIGVLSRAPLIGLLDRDALRLLAFAAETRKLRAGDVLFRKGDRSDGAYVVASGSIALDGDEGAGTDFVAEPGSLVGRVALFARIRRPATAVAREPSVVLRISPTVMRRVLEEFPDVAVVLHGALAEDLATVAGDLDRIRRRLDSLDPTPG